MGIFALQAYELWPSLYPLDVPQTHSASLPYAYPSICIVAPEYLEEATMLDLAMLAIAIGLFALTIGYAVACDRL
jgi:hypothetical protein